MHHLGVIVVLVVVVVAAGSASTSADFSAANEVIGSKRVEFPGSCAAVVQALFVADTTSFFRSSFLQRFSCVYGRAFWVLLVFGLIEEGTCVG